MENNLVPPWFFRLRRLTVYHDYVGPRSYQVSASTSVQDVKQMLYEETDLPVAEQQLTHGGKLVSCPPCLSSIIMSVKFIRSTDLKETLRHHSIYIWDLKETRYDSQLPIMLLFLMVLGIKQVCMQLPVWGQMGFAWWKAPGGGLQGQQPHPTHPTPQDLTHSKTTRT